MNKILNKTLILLFIFGLYSCSYKPIFLEKNYDFKIEEVLLRGDKNINRIIKNKLNFIKSSEVNKKKNYTIEINSSKNREIVSKDSKGDPLKFEMNILVEYKIMNNNTLLLNNKVEKNNIYNNDSDQFELEQTEEIILENLSKNISDTIISSIINLNDN
tara:strand:- start:628 stop:1104 length:477 start_codon:yes stop_codon:yes gene_type:complete